MSAFRISNAAIADMLDIGRYTQKAWGLSQSNLYLKRLDKSFHIIAKEPKIGRSCDNVIYGYRKYPEGKHIIFYRIADDKVVEIMRILHQAMDIFEILK